MSAGKNMYWKKWAKKHNYPVVKLQKDKDNYLYGVCNLVLIHL